MRVVVTGGGAVGRHLSADLAARGHDLTLSEQESDVVDKVPPILPDVPGVAGRRGNVLVALDVPAVASTRLGDRFRVEVRVAFLSKGNLPRFGHSHSATLSRFGDHFFEHPLERKIEMLAADAAQQHRS